ncbi:MAG TPA: cupin domain-containing protein [Methylomirabilota bacterium]|nr:cupin domain-containing protein [Methylomirabilota bacterium]
MALPARDGAWRRVAPGAGDVLEMARTGVPFQIALDGRYDRSGDPGRIAPALSQGATLYFPQIHQVLPRVMRLMVALRAAFLGPGRVECSFLFLTRGGREGMGWHHDGPVDQFWLQLVGTRTVSVGPPLPGGTPEDLDPAAVGRLRRRAPRRWRTLDLAPGTLFHMPPRTPHRVVCRRPSLALSLTWKRRIRPLPRSERARAAALADWDVASGRAEPIPAASRTRFWTQVPAVAGAVDSRGEFPLWLGDGTEIRLPARVRPLAALLALMPALPRAAVARDRDTLRALLAYGILGPRDLPLRIVPAEPKALDGWNFA